MSLVGYPKYGNISIVSKSVSYLYHSFFSSLKLVKVNSFSLCERSQKKVSIQWSLYQFVYLTVSSHSSLNDGARDVGHNLLVELLGDSHILPEISGDWRSGLENAEPTRALSLHGQEEEEPQGPGEGDQGPWPGGRHQTGPAYWHGTWETSGEAIVRDTGQTCRANIQHLTPMSILGLEVGDWDYWR